jgi:hypothetical protein
MSSELDDPTERPLTLQPARGGVDAVAIVSILAGAAAIVTLVAGVPTWAPLLLASLGLFASIISLFRSRPSTARWLSTVGTVVSVVPFLLFFFYITT